jgi:hypothetical protein
MCCGFGSCSSYVAIDSPDSPQYPLWHFGALGLINLANVHPSSSAGNLKNVSVRRSHFKYAILFAQSFYWTLDLYGAVDCIDHGNLLPGKKKMNRGCKEARGS